MFPSIELLLLAWLIPIYCQDKICIVKPLEDGTDKILIQRMALVRAVGMTAVPALVGPKTPAFKEIEYS